MNKLKYIGISALAGTLVSLSAAQAGGVSVTGSWELSYTHQPRGESTGNPIGMNKNISFGGAGDVTDGGGVTWATTIGGSDALGLSSASMNINMGGIATLAYDSGTGGYGANAVDNIVPTAWEEIDYGLTTGISDLGAVSSSKGVVNFTVKAPGAGTGLSISYISRMGGTHVADGGADPDATGGRGFDVVADLVNVDMKHFGMRLGVAGEVELMRESCKKQQSKDITEQLSCLTGKKDDPYGISAYSTFQFGPLHLGGQATFKDPMDPTIAGTKNTRSMVLGTALVFGDNISVSYGTAWDRKRFNDASRCGDEGKPSGGASIECSGKGEYETTKFHGFSASINFGPVALKGTRNYVDGAGENWSSEPKRHTEMNLSIAF